MRRLGDGASPSAPEPPPKPLAKASRRLRRAEQEALRPPKRRYKLSKVRGEPALITVTLQMRHSFNGKFYGPGTVRVTPTKAQIFLNTEHEAGQKESSLSRQEAFIIGVGPGGPMKRQVPWAQFDTILSREELPLTHMEGRR